MPLFTSASGFQINGGTFIDNAGDMTIIHPTQAIPEQNIGSLEFAMEGPSHEDPWATYVASGPSFSNSLPSTFLPQEHKFNSQHHLGSLSTTSSSQDFTAGYHEQFYESVNSMGSEYPLSSFVPVAGTPGDFSEISPSDNPFGLTSTGLLPSPPLSAQIFSEEMQPQITPSSNLQLLTGPFGEPTLPGMGSVAGTSCQPWDDRSQEQRVINGGTFIGGNLNYFHTTVMPPSISADQAAGETNNCPPPSRIFHGRQAILNKMHEFFNKDIGKQHIYLLYGLGGAGKTQIGLKFINDSSLVEEHSNLENIGSSSQDALKWLATNQEDWLLFYDNADDPKIDLNRFIPQCTHGNIIITTRNPGLCVYAGAQSAVSDIEEGDGLALLLKSAAQDITPANERMAAEIVKAGAFISQSGTLNNYLDICRKNQAQLLSEKPAQSHDNYAQTVYTTWQMSFEQLSQPAAMFLQLCSFLHWDGISEEIFSRAARYRFQMAIPSREELKKPLEFLQQFTDPAGQWDTLHFLKVTNEIKAYSLMTLDPKRKSFSIHPLVHSWSQTTITDQQSYHSIMAAIMGMSIEEIPYDHQQLASLRLISHVDSLRHIKQDVMVDFGSQYGNIYYYAGQYEEAKGFYLGCLAKQKQALGDAHPDTLRAMGNLGWTYHQLSQLQKAAELEVIVLEKQKQVLGDDHPDTLWTMGNLASTYHSRGDFHRAQELDIAVLKKRQQVLGEDHPDTFMAMGNLAATYNHLGEFRQAEELEVIVLEKRKQVLGDDHPNTLWTMGNLGWTYYQLAQFQKAEELQVIVLEKRKKVLGGNHPHTLYIMRNLALTYRCLDKLSEAEELEAHVHNYEEALKASISDNSEGSDEEAS
ncbi:hypothetical protein B0H13DRAFT_2280736 [Mycena leptocephala]|nr:hypothetical protein B0H13DRAFT_2280736 [Mycena leptocephala]